jgi:(p)ppGpp synthase/HD superfamily hydrolase
VAAAWLHDVLEDTAETVESLQQAGIPAAVIAAVDLVTKRDGVAYDAYLAKIRQHDVAREVKIADMLDNLSDSPVDAQIIKYARGLLVLAQ